MELTDQEVALRLLVALVFGILIGIERQWHHGTAGVKTNALVALGATAFTLIAARGFGDKAALPQVAAGVVSGIGFIGGGVIMRQGVNVQGVNSAATLWVSAGVGLAIGSGFYRLAEIIVVLMLGVQTLLRLVASWIDRYSHSITPHNHQLLISCQQSAAETVRARWQSFSQQAGINVTKYRECNQPNGEMMLETTFGLSATRAEQMISFIQQVGALTGVIKAEWSQCTE